MHGMHNRFFRGRFFGGHFFFRIVITILAIAAVVFIYRMFKERKTSENSSALSILSERLAKGEISQEEYDDIYNTLKK